MLNLRRIAHIRLALGDGVPVHADPAYWPADELPVNISRHFIAMMAGVPMLSVELSDLSPEAEKMLSARKLWDFMEDIPDNEDPRAVCRNILEELLRKAAPAV